MENGKNFCFYAENAKFQAIIILSDTYPDAEKHACTVKKVHVL